MAAQAFGAVPVRAGMQQEGMSALPPAGRYVSLRGGRHEVIATGPDGFRVTGDGGLCVDLMRNADVELHVELRDMIAALGLVAFAGESCGRGAAAGRWTGSFSTKYPGRIILLPPGTFADRTVAPIELVRADGG